MLEAKMFFIFLDAEIITIIDNRIFPTKKF